MSIRAYKVIIKEIEKEASFNLSLDEDLIDFLILTDEFKQNEADYGETLSVSVKAIKKALKNKALWVKVDYRPERLKRDIKGLKDDDWIEYECY